MHGTRIRSTTHANGADPTASASSLRRSLVGRRRQGGRKPLPGLHVSPHTRVVLDPTHVRQVEPPRPSGNTAQRPRPRIKRAPCPAAALQPDTAHQQFPATHPRITYTEDVLPHHRILLLRVRALPPCGRHPQPEQPTVTVTVTAPAATPTSAGDCNVSDIQCCNSVIDSNSASASLLLGLLGVVLGDITGLIGLNCSPISVVGVGSGSACDASPVCCTNNNVGGLLSIGCVPITL
ncbi:Hydrophobin-3 [Grifola frondosa]|uniref:Hydrophobin n=1 Tax=Grifola frondosa TaxID=5627 RepID=A0A1C7MKD9_GRIFR|nr:Hydrophobin-3 [Grifola frondosa]